MKRKIKKDYTKRIKNLRHFHNKWLFNIFATLPVLTNEQKKNINLFLNMPIQRVNIDNRNNPTNICLDSAWDKNIISYFRLSRHRVKNYVGRGKLPGIRKASW